MHKEYSKLFWALADMNRLKIVDLLAANKDTPPADEETGLPGELSAAVLLENFPFSQPTLSHHMKILCDSGMVVKRKLGKNVYYALDNEGIDKLQDFLDLLLPPEEE